ncbi:MAG: AI-2E family transporter, partial [Betaproteobacteria bacterium]
MTTFPEPVSDKIFVRRAVEAAIRIGLVALLVAWCFQIVWPFIVPVVWGIIIAVAVYPGYRPLEAVLGGRRRIAATLFTLLMLILLIGPTVMLAGTLAESAQGLAADLIDGTLSIPAPPDSISSWPIIGDPMERFWRLASVNLGAALAEIRPQIAAFGRWLLATAAELGLGILQFVLAIIIAGVLLANAQGGGHAARSIATRLAGERGADYAELGQATVRSVARGILGVALIQSLLAGLGFLAVGVPGAGLLALVCLLLAVVQIGPVVVLIATAIYVFSTADTFTAVIFLIWSIFVGLIDNVLKPVLLGRGVKVPMIVIFVGAIGGFLASGIIGLFVGSVVLALSFTLFKAWLAEPLQPSEEQSISN